MKRTYGIIAAVFGLGLMATVAFAQDVMKVRGFGPPPMMWMGDGPGMMLPMLLRGLDLTDEQEAQIKTIMSNNRGKLRPLFQQLRTLHEEVANKLLTTGDISRDDLAPQLQQMEQIRGQLMEEGLTLMLDVRKVLTAEQLTKAAQLKERMQALHQEMRGLFFNKELPPPGSEEEGDVMFFEHP